MTYFPQGTIFNDSLFQDSVAQATARQQLSLNRAGESWANTQYDYGLGSGAANPYGQQQLLNRNQQIQSTDFVNQSGRRPGGIRSGAFKVRQGNMLFDQGQAQNALQLGFQRAGVANAQGIEDINNTYNQDLYNAGAGSVQRKLEADAAAGVGAQAPVADTSVPTASRVIAGKSGSISGSLKFKNKGTKYGKPTLAKKNKKLSGVL